MTTAAQYRREARQRETRAQGDLRRARALARYHAKKEPKPQHIPKIISAVLAAPALETDTVKALASRENFAGAVDHLSDLIGWRAVSSAGAASPAAILWAPATDHVRSYRIACGLALFDITKSDNVRRDREWIRGVDSDAARVALALLGEPPDWTTATQRERAACLLALIVETRRGLP